MKPGQGCQAAPAGTPRKTCGPSAHTPHPTHTHPPRLRAPQKSGGAGSRALLLARRAAFPHLAGREAGRQRPPRGSRQLHSHRPPFSEPLRLGGNLDQSAPGSPRPSREPEACSSARFSPAAPGPPAPLPASSAIARSPTRSRGAPINQRGTRGALGGLGRPQLISAEPAALAPVGGGSHSSSHLREWRLPAAHRAAAAAAAGTARGAQPSFRRAPATTASPARPTCFT